MQIHVQASGDNVYLVEVSEGKGSTTHRVTASAAQLARYGESDALRVIEASFEFLLEREPKEAILPEFELTVIERYFPEYPDEIRRRLG